MKHDQNHRRPPEEIQAEIEQTRHQLDETLSALESRLTPGQLMDQGLDYLRRSGARQYVSNLGETAKQDPLPLALVGIGLAWLMASGGRSGVRDTTGEAHASSHSPGVKERVSHTAHRVSERAHAARERAGQLGDSARHGAQRVRDGYRHVLEEQPLAIGAIGLALGAVLGASAPRTRIEERVSRDGEARREPLAAGTPDFGPEPSAVQPEPSGALPPQPSATLHH